VDEGRGCNEREGEGGEGGDEPGGAAFGAAGVVVALLFAQRGEE